MTNAPHGAGYRTYWLAWLALLLVTVTMVFVGSRPLLVSGMVIKAAIIALFFMHLKNELRGLVLTVLLGIFATAAILVVLIVPDGMAM